MIFILDMGYIFHLNSGVWGGWLCVFCNFLFLDAVTTMDCLIFMESKTIAIGLLNFLLLFFYRLSIQISLEVC